MSLQPHIWTVGDWQHADFRAARTWLESTASCMFFATVEDAIASANQTGTLIPPSAIVVAQSRPGQMTAHEVERLHATAPLARFVALTAAWCEGEGRTGRPWPGVERVPWRSWQNRLPVALGLSQGTAHVPWLPRTATPTERIERSVQAMSEMTFSGNAEIHTNSLATFHAWNDLLDQLGLKGAWICPGDTTLGNAQIALVDGWESVPHSQPSANTEGGPAHVLMLHWPRPDDVARGENLGFYAVLAQPFLISDLVGILGGVLPLRMAGRETAA